MTEQVKAEEVKVEETTEQPAPVESNDEVDFDAELEEAMTRAKNKTFAEERIARKESHSEESEEEPDLAEKVAQKLRPEIKAIIESNTQGSKLDTVSGGNSSKRKLIEWHMTNSVNPGLDFDTRLEHAVAIANKRTIAKTAKEINLAQQNRTQISNSSMGASTETHGKPGDNILSDAQSKALEAQADAISRSFTDPKRRAEVKKRFLENARNQLAKR